MYVVNNDIQAVQGTVILVAAFCKRDSKESRNAFAEHEGARVFP